MKYLGPNFAYFRHLVSSSFWFTPSVTLLVAIGLSLLTLAVDRGPLGELVRHASWIYRIGPEGARLMLSTIAGSMITVTSLVFSLTLIALTLASQQLGPRVIKLFMRDRINQFVLGIFLATFVYSLLVLRTINREDMQTFVPYCSVIMAMLLVIVSFLLLIYFIHHTTLLIQADSVLATVGRLLARDIESNFPARDADFTDSKPTDKEPPDDKSLENVTVVTAGEDGYVQLVSRDALVDAAETFDVTVKMECRAGHFVIETRPIARVWSSEPPNDAVIDAVRAAVVLGPVRTPAQDVEFSLRAIVDIAVRALSPSLNDFHTAMAGIDYLGSALARVLRRDFPARACPTTDGRRVAVFLFPQTTEGIMHAAFQQIAEATQDNITVGIHLLATLTSLARIARTADQKELVRAYADMVGRALEETAEDPRDGERVQRLIEEFSQALGGDRSERR